MAIMMLDKVKDTVSGFAGTATGRCLYASGCVQWQVTASTLQEGKPAIIWVDEVYLEVVEAVGKKAVAAGPGGPQSTPPSRSHPTR